MMIYIENDHELEAEIIEQFCSVRRYYQIDKNFKTFYCENLKMFTDLMFVFPGEVLVSSAAV